MAEPGSQRFGYVGAVLTAAAIVGALLVVGLLARQLSQVLLMLFAAALLAVLLDALAHCLRRWLRLGRLPALLTVIALVAAVTAAFVWLAGPRINTQAAVLVERLPEAADELESRIRSQPWVAELFEAPTAQQLLPRPAAIAEAIPGVFTTALGAIVNVTIILVIGFFLALDPAVYRSSLLALLPRAGQERGRAVLDALSHALRWWLVGRLASMLAVGVLTSFGLMLIDMPLVLVLGLLAGLLSFVPFLGPILSAVPAILIALVGDPFDALWVILVYGAVQFLEGNLITPLIQKRVVSLPPAVLLAAQMLMGVLFGLAGVVLATPLAVTVIVIGQVVYVRDLLGHRVHVLGESSR